MLRPLRGDLRRSDEKRSFMSSFCWSAKKRARMRISACGEPRMGAWNGAMTELIIGGSNVVIKAP